MVAELSLPLIRLESKYGNLTDRPKRLVGPGRVRASRQHTRSRILICTIHARVLGLVLDPPCLTLTFTFIESFFLNESDQAEVSRQTRRGPVGLAVLLSGNAGARAHLDMQSQRGTG